MAKRESRPPGKKPREIEWYGGRRRELQPGQITIGYSQLADALGAERTSTYDRMQKLKKLNAVTLESRTVNRTGFTVVTICRWDYYQSMIGEGRTANRTVKDQRAERRPNAGRTQADPPKRLRDSETKTHTEAGATAPAVSDSDFDRFWMAYPKKMQRGRALNEWRRLNPPIDPVLAALAGPQEWDGKPDRYIPHPATWLRDQRWQDNGTATAPRYPDATDIIRKMKEQAKGP